MINKIQNITDKTLFNQILNEFFMNKTSYVKASTGNIQVKFLNCSGGLAAVRIPYHVSPPKNSLMFTRNNDNIIFAYMKFWEARDADMFIFNPVKFQIVTAERKNERKAVGMTEDKNQIYAANIITDYLIQCSLLGRKESVEKIKERIIYDNGQEYDYIKLFFNDKEANDPRMTYFHDKRAPFLIPYIKKDPADMKDDLIEYYLNNIYTADNDLMKRTNLVSEAAVPFLYDAKIPYGYIQVNGSAPFTNGTLPAVKRIASLIEQLGKDYNIFTELNERVLVSDVSPEGFGIVFKEKKYIPYYKENSHVSLDLILPNHKNVSMFAKVKHLDMLEDKFIRVGFEIVEVDKASIINYDSFLKSEVSAA